MPWTNASQISCAYELAGDLIKMQILFSRSGGRAWDSAFATSSHQRLMLQVEDYTLWNNL